MSTKYWLVQDQMEFDVFLNLRKSGIEIMVSTRPDDIAPLSVAKKFKTSPSRWIEAVTTTPEQETLLLLCCDKLTFIEEV
jgi:hypothetical protein